MEVRLSDPRPPLVAPPRVDAPPCVYADDAPLRELGTAELLVVASIRLWALPFKYPEESHPDWRAGFLAAGIEDEGAPAFDILFRIVLRSATRPLDLRCPRCAHLGKDEAWLLQLASLLQRERLAEAAAVLGEWLRPDALPMALLPAKAFADALSAGRLRIPLRHASAAMLADYADRGFALVQ